MLFYLCNNDIIPAKFHDLSVMLTNDIIPAKFHDLSVMLTNLKDSLDLTILF